MTETTKRWLLRGIAAAALAGLAFYGWQRYTDGKADLGIVSGNGRIEAVEIDIAAKTPGRVANILVREGDFVTAGQPLARIDAEVLQAQKRAAEAQLLQAQSAVATARNQLAQRQSEKASAEAVVAQRKVDVASAQRQVARSQALAEKGFLSRQAAEDAASLVSTAEAAMTAARAQVAAAEAGIATARSQVSGAESAVAAAQANIERIQADIDDSDLKAPRDGRVQYLVARPGEIVGAGGRVLNLMDLTDVYMTFFLPTEAAGRVAIGAEVRLVLDAAPQYVVPATVSFVADSAQFTPKTVETKSEREKLMFRVRAQIPQDLLKKHVRQVKTGLPGVAYVRLDPAAAWPARLEVKLPQ
ncbi:MAG: HlyD family secretion protein [Proteobacteria bacterium]|nr:HlyD family secretion protein [Pseudomonadota bacterium]